jgi:hypothetical protein
MNPRTIQDSQFVPLHFLYEHEGFTLAFGRWENKDHALAMRWDGDGDAPGFPRGAGGQPKWFLVKRELRWPLLCTLLSSPPIHGSNVAGIAAALNVIVAETSGGGGLLQEPLASQWQAIVGKQIRIEPLPDLEAANDSQYMFRIQEVTESDVSLEKLSTNQSIRIPLFALSRPWGKETDGGFRAVIRHGALRFLNNTQRWRWAPDVAPAHGLQRAAPQSQRTVTMQAGHGRKIPGQF